LAAIVDLLVVWVEILPDAVAISAAVVALGFSLFVDPLEEPPALEGGVGCRSGIGGLRKSTPQVE
jgi:hypothetical protein